MCPVQRPDGLVNDPFMDRLKGVISHTKGSITCFVCSTFRVMNMASWMFIAESMPNLKKLMLRCSQSMLQLVSNEAFTRWPLLESLIAPSVSRFILRAISENCPNFSELKIQGLFGEESAQSVVMFLPKLKVLSLRGSFVYEEALDIILEKLEHLEVLNLSHCILFQSVEHGKRLYFPKLDKSMLERTARLKMILFCVAKSCPVCLSSVRQYRMISNFLNYEDTFCKMDEVSSLSVTEPSM